MPLPEDNLADQAAIDELYRWLYKRGLGRLQAKETAATLARLIPTAQRIGDDQAELITWLATLTEQERTLILAWAQEQGLHWGQDLRHVDEVVDRIDDELMP